MSRRRCGSKTNLGTSKSSYSSSSLPTWPSASRVRTEGFPPPAASANWAPYHGAPSKRDSFTGHSAHRKAHRLFDCQSGPNQGDRSVGLRSFIVVILQMPEFLRNSSPDPKSPQRTPKEDRFTWFAPIQFRVSQSPEWPDCVISQSPSLGANILHIFRTIMPAVRPN